MPPPHRFRHPRYSYDRRRDGIRVAAALIDQVRRMAADCGAEFLLG